MKLIVLAGGDSFEVDGFNKLLIRHPFTKKTIIEQYSEFFETSEIEIVVGYRALEIMNTFPMYKYHYNQKWQHTGNSYSLALALNREPCYVMSSDFFLGEGVKNKIEAYENCIIGKRTENRLPNSINGSVDEKGNAAKIYRGKCENLDPALPGIFKISDPEILIEWKSRCLDSPRLFCAENLPIERFDIPVLEIMDDELIEINFPQDFIRLLDEFRSDEKINE
jgi:choline kinase